MVTQSELVETVLDRLDVAHGKRLKNIALTSIRSQMSGIGYRPRIKEQILKEKAGVFVTLYNRDELRGCIGYVYPTYEIWAATKKAAIHAAFLDSRFNSIQRSELETLDVEISILGNIEKMKVRSQKSQLNLNLGKDGLMVVGKGSSGLLLPQVAEELGADEFEFLEATCEKAGLPPDAWKDPSVSVYKFPAVIF